jgi:hypothetical protein
MAALRLPAVYQNEEGNKLLHIAGMPCSGEGDVSSDVPIQLRTADGITLAAGTETHRL